VDGKISELI